MLRKRRIAVRCRVEFDHPSGRVVAESEDLSPQGLFVRAHELLSVGTVLEVSLRLPNGMDFVVLSRVAHQLNASAARVLGRQEGMGFAFVDRSGPERDRLLAALGELFDELTPEPRPVMGGSHVLVVEANPQMRDRLTNALSNQGFDVASALSGAQALAACASRRPDVLLVTAAMPRTDGWALAEVVSTDRELADLPIVLILEDSSDMTRLEAYRLGIQEVIPRPFTDEELCLRLRRAALSSSNAMLRGALSEISVGTLLSLLEFERKSGTLRVFAKEQFASILFYEGRAVRIEGLHEELDARQRLMHVIDWEHGHFEFAPGDAFERVDEIGVRIQQVLLEHARLRDEESGLHVIEPSE